MSGNDCDTPRRPVLLGINQVAKRMVLFRPRCKMWDCPVCGIINRGRWAARAYQGSMELINRGHTINFLTLTSHEGLNTERTIFVFKNAWDVLNKRARRAAPGYQYILVPEPHQDGRLHAHLIETSSLGTRWFKDAGRSVGLGYMAEETPVMSPEGAAWYVVKYINKGLALHKWPEDFHRVRTSRAWPKLPPLHDNANWEFVVLGKHKSIEETIARYEGAGYTCASLGAIAAWDFVRDIDKVF